MTLDTETYSLPAYWASYLINGDDSGLEDGETKLIDDFCKREKLGNCLDCSEEPEFSWHNEGPEPNLGGDVLTFTFEVI